jgi:hypothetical protein
MNHPFAASATLLGIITGLCARLRVNLGSLERLALNSIVQRRNRARSRSPGRSMIINRRRLRVDDPEHRKRRVPLPLVALHVSAHRVKVDPSDLSPILLHRPPISLVPCLSSRLRPVTARTRGEGQESACVGHPECDPSERGTGTRCAPSTRFPSMAIEQRSADLSRRVSRQLRDLGRAFWRVPDRHIGDEVPVLEVASHEGPTWVRAADLVETTRNERLQRSGEQR